MLCRGWRGVPPQLVRAQLHTARHLPRTPVPSHLPPPPLCWAQQQCGPGMSQLTPALSAQVVWVDWAVFWFVPDQLN